MFDFTARVSAAPYTEQGLDVFGVVFGVHRYLRRDRVRAFRGDEPTLQPGHLEVTVRQAEAEIPAHGQQDHLRREPKPRERRR